MNITKHPVDGLGAVRDLRPVGVPAVEGRWQPSRAGVVNSWAWSNEVLVFADGWMTLTGPNGSGKSLTASMLITLLLDGDTSQTALSVSGKAAGTLTSRHTDRNEREDRTGAWWLEYGRHDPRTGEISYLTTGLWLRAVGGNLQRAFFISPGRVGEHLVLERDGSPVRIDDLAIQLTATEGEIFTSAQALRSKARDHLAAVNDEPGYRNAVRVRLFAPLDEVQFEALTGVLRSLRSLRTAEAIPPAQMRAVLTEALPALDPDRLTVIGEAMERISELENQLADMRDEAKQLAATDKRYQRYVEALVNVEAAQLTAANTEFDAQTRRTREATATLETAQREQREAAGQLKVLNTRIFALEGRRDAADTALRDHAGAELPHMELRAAELARAADHAGQRAEVAAEDATTAAEQADEAATTAQEAGDHLATLSDELRAASRVVGADAALERLVATTALLSTGQADETSAADVAQTCATPVAWVEARVAQLQRVDEVLRAHASAQHGERAAAEELRRAERLADEARGQADKSIHLRRAAETALVASIVRWEADVRHLGRAPRKLIEPRDGADSRLALDRLAAWLTSVADDARDRIDLVGRRQAAATAGALVAEAVRASVQARADYDSAIGLSEVAASALREERERVMVEESSAERKRAAADQTHRRDVDVARHDVAAAEETAVAADAEAHRAATLWIEQAYRWRGAARFLNAVELPEANEHDVDPAVVRLAVEQAHAQAGIALGLSVADARRDVDRAESAVVDVAAELAEARRAAPVPETPPWRDRRPEDGVPLWALVDFAGHLSDEEADRLEGALLVTGLLDALVTSDGRAVSGDLVITADRPVPGRTLGDLLDVESSPAIPAERVRALLRAIPVDDDAEHGRLRSGVLTAAAPVGYRSEFIGQTTRERVRLRRVANLEDALSSARDDVDAARRGLADREADVLAAVEERDAFPSHGELVAARREAARQHAAAETVRRETADRIARADLTRQRILAELDAAAAERSARIAAAQQRLQYTEEVAARTRLKAEAAERVAEERRAAEDETLASLAAGEETQREADAEYASFPPVAEVRAAHVMEERCEEDLRRSEAAVIAAAERYREAGDAVHDALRELNRQATLSDGTLLPTERTALAAHGTTVANLGHRVDLWGQAAIRVAGLFHQARRAGSLARQRAEVLAKARAEAEDARLTAVREASAVAEARELYGAEYEQLRATRQRITDDLLKAKEDAALMVELGQDAGNAAAAAQATLDGIAPLREAAEQRRDTRLRQFGALVDEGFASVPDDLPRTPAGKPAHLTAALQWARRLLADHSATGDRLGVLVQARGRALAQLESSVRTTSTALARFDRQVVLVTVDGTEWRRAVVADPGASRGEDLHVAVEKLEATAAQLEDDLRDDVKRTLKTSLFTELRRDILIRLDAARELVRQIRRTLDGVRTGVARVGVQVEWSVREDEDARRMVELISQPQSDEIFEDMYTVLKQRMSEKAGDSWKDRVAHTFDYRSWHDWKITVTHSSFTDQKQEKFREVTARSNPLDSLSTGERRLATMLPLLAAAWSMYSGEHYSGPRWVSIDEIDAAFDEPNLRQVLALLRSWEFDVLATAPFITPMLKKESGQVVVHQVVTAGKHRVTVPWLWKGHGEAEPLTLELGA
ncbi:putative exonuclease SbcCD C subunit [Saccharothrix saharensis]|uniref:Putative exonuclease SbcCD C subunit n=1 Tax=Saccharothrix saharensis TaxID=571190 RepID=A0A543JRJ2_9PSEU|nr:SbcC/MukB-like Walker B domain-containing protein [Saccharothrix saharensis]TQM85471.1 putative exonuclease SbcCD C subunit [Saccharothrix saharensis]